MKPTRSPLDLREEQHTIMRHLVAHPASMLWVDMGKGKTVCALSAFDFLQRIGSVRALLVVAPLLVCHTVWEQETQKWSHLTHLRVNKVLGDEIERLQGLQTAADVYVINYENLQWLRDAVFELYLRKGALPPFDMIVWDEIDKIKNKVSKRSAAFRSIAPYFTRRIGMTGTPASQGLLDLHGQFLVVDDGARLGVKITDYKEKYFWQVRYTLNPFDDSAAKVQNLVQDITLSISGDPKDFPKIETDCWAVLPPDARKLYNNMESNLFASTSQNDFEAGHTAAAQIKCAQIANGALYMDGGSGEWEALHDAKLDILEGIVVGRKPALVAYQFVHDAERIQQRFPHAVNLTNAAARDVPAIIAQWQRGEIKMLIGHPLSISHGIDGLQYGGNTIVWFGVPWSLRQYRQLNARIARSGQECSHTDVYRILARDTVDEMVAESITEKATYEDALINAVERYRTNRGM